MQVRFFDIRWDMTADDSEEPHTPDECGLPPECVLEMEDDIDLTNDGADVLSQHYGWLVDGCSWEVVGAEARKGHGSVATAQEELDMPRHLKTIRVPVVISFTTDPAELDDRQSEPAPKKESLVAWLKDSLVMKVDTEDYGQPGGAVFAASGIDWDAAILTEEQDTSHQ